MLARDIHFCPICGGAVNVEHYARVKRAGDVEEFLYCESCERGWWKCTDFDGDALSLDYRLRTEPESFRRFLLELEAARAA